MHDTAAEQSIDQVDPAKSIVWICTPCAVCDLRFWVTAEKPHPCPRCKTDIALVPFEGVCT